MDEALIIDRLTKEYPKVTALNKASFNVKAGTIHGLLGPNGAGKTTTMNILAGLIRPTTGKVNVLGLDFNEKNRSKIINSIGYLPEIPPLYQEQKVNEFLAFVAKIHKVEKQSVDISVDSVIDRIGLKHLKDRPIRLLSKGQKQRVGLAQALVFRPKILILDEPTVGLDPTSIIEIRSLIKELTHDHTVLLSTHLLNEAQLLCSDITILNHGKVVLNSRVEELKERFGSEKVYTAELSSWNKENEDFFLKLPYIKKIDRHKDNPNKIIIDFYITDQEDIRKKIIQEIMGQDCELLSFTSKELHLEDVFIKTIQNEMK